VFGKAVRNSGPAYSAKAVGGLRER
jgi:hypothetical protein